MTLITSLRRRPTERRSAVDGDLTIDGAVEVTDDDAPAGTEGGDTGDAVGPADRHAGWYGRVRTALRWTLTVLAGLFVLVALVVPNRYSQVTTASLARIPVEALLAAAVVLALPRTRRVVAVLAGVGTGLLLIVKIIDMGFYLVLNRPADPILDWTLLGNSMDFLTESYGRAGAIGAAVVAGLLVAAVLALMTLSILRLSRLAVQRRTAATRTVLVLAVIWAISFVFGVQFAPNAPFAAKSAAGFTYYRALQAGVSLQDQERFAKESAVDAFARTPGKDLLTGLRGKDVMLAFVESYGRDAIEDPVLAPGVGAVLDDGNRRLATAGFAARSGFLTSPVYGGGSWLAHATLLSGLWIDNQQRYNNLVASERLTIGSAFRKADWETVGVMPAITRAWPEGAFFGYDRVYAEKELGYRGPKFGFAPMPDQYTLSTFERTEHARPGRGPVMSEIELISSHAPWTPVPDLVDWNDVGDGSGVFDAAAAAGDSADSVWLDPAKVRTQYRKSIEYSVRTLVSYLERYGTDKTVLVFLGDHQPSPIVTGEDATRDVPVTIVARDPAVLEQVSGWGWDEGLKPGPQAPVWKMSDFRDRFLTAFGSRPSA